MKRGRRSNWDSIVLHIGSRVWNALVETGQIAATAVNGDPSVEALLRLGRATLHASAQAERNQKSKESKNC